MNIDHINIKANYELLKDVKEFYCFVFGMKSSSRPSFSNSGYWLYAGDKALVHLTESEEHSQSDVQGSLDHIAFNVDDLTSVLNKLIELGVDYSSSEVPDIGLSQIFFNDPAGVRIEVTSV